MNKTYVYKLKKSTKNTHVYESQEIGVYYLPKNIFEGNPPNTLEVTLQTVQA